jgi:hypothetical protein
VFSGYRLGDVRTVAVEDWLRELDLANGSKAKIRNAFHALYSHAERFYELLVLVDAMRDGRVRERELAGAN